MQVSDTTGTRVRTCKELLQLVRRVDEEPNQVSVTEMTELQEELGDALQVIRSRMTQLMMERISTLHEQERKLTEENEELQLQIESAKQRDNKIEDGSSTVAGLNDFATDLTHQQQTHQLIPTLHLFKD